MIKLDNIAEQLFNKIRGRFSKVTIGDSEGNVTNEPNLARYFDFDYTVGGDKSLGNVSVSLDEEEGLVVMFSKDFVEGSYGSTKDDWYNFLKEMRQFAKKRLMKFEVRDLNRSNLTRRDYQFLAQNRPGDKTMQESKMYGTNKTSFQKIGNAKIHIKHSAPINTESVNSRTGKIGSIFIESPDGEKFKYPFKHLSGARALARHVAEGGHAYDDFGKHITGLSGEMAKLRKFNTYMNRSSVMAEALQEYTDVVKERVNNIKKEIQNLQKPAYYASALESFEPSIVEDVPTDVADAWVDQLTVKQFNEELKDVFPYIYNLVGETKVKEIALEDIITEADQYVVQAGDTVASIARKAGVPVDTIIKNNNLDDKATIYPGQKLAIPPKGVAEEIGVDDVTKTGSIDKLEGPAATVKIRPGMTLFAIAKMFNDLNNHGGDINDFVKEIMQANAIMDPRKLQVGDVIEIPYSMGTNASGSSRGLPPGGFTAYETAVDEAIEGLMGQFAEPITEARACNCNEDCACGGNCGPNCNCGPDCGSVTESKKKLSEHDTGLQLNTEKVQDLINRFVAWANKETPPPADVDPEDVDASIRFSEITPMSEITQEIWDTAHELAGDDVVTLDHWDKATEQVISALPEDEQAFVRQQLNVPDPTDPKGNVDIKKLPAEFAKWFKKLQKWAAESYKNLGFNPYDDAESDEQVDDYPDAIRRLGEDNHTDADNAKLIAKLTELLKKAEAAGDKEKAEKIKATIDRLMLNYHAYTNVTPDTKLSHSMYSEGIDKKLPISEFILSYFDRHTGQFPKGETAVLTMVEKEYGENFIKPAQAFIEQVHNKVSEVMGYKDNDLGEGDILNTLGPAIRNIHLTHPEEKKMQAAMQKHKDDAIAMQDAMMDLYSDDPDFKAWIDKDGRRSKTYQSFLRAIGESNNLGEGFDPEHFDDEVEMEIPGDDGEMDDATISYTATIIDGKPVVHPRSIRASAHGNNPNAKLANDDETATYIAQQDKEVLATLQQHAEELWAERDNDYKGIEYMKKAGNAKADAEAKELNRITALAGLR
jgi:nucleoid-associated protein YgaU